METNIIYNEDCLIGLKKIPNKSIDFIITSPPYNKCNNSGKIVERVEYVDYCDNRDEKEYQEWQIKVLNELYRVLKDDGHLFYNHKNRYVDKKQINPLEWILKSDFIVRQEIIWDRMITGNIRGWRFWQIDEKIYWLQKQTSNQKEIPSYIASLTNIWRITPSRKKDTNHPCSFPLELVERCLSIDDNIKGKIVLDPFMGSGTTAIAAIRFDCNYIGFEISKEYIDIANKRIDKERMNPRLF